MQEGIRSSMTDQAPRTNMSSPKTNRLKMKRDQSEQPSRRLSKRRCTEREFSPESSPPTQSKVSMAFPNGALRITRTPGRKDQKNCVNLGNLIHKDHLVSACIYAFYIARNELFRHLPLSKSSNDVPVSIRLADFPTVWWLSRGWSPKTAQATS